MLEPLQPVAYRSEAEQDSDDSLQGMLGQLKHAAQWIARSETLQVLLFSMGYIYMGCNVSSCLEYLDISHCLTHSSQASSYCVSSFRLYRFVFSWLLFCHRVNLT